MVNFNALSAGEAFFLLKKTPDHAAKEALEAIIRKDAIWASRYAGFVIGGPWPPGEETIRKNAQSSYDYAWRTIKGRWLPGERVIKKDPQWAFYYALDVVKGRWLEGEPAIMQNAEYCYQYAKDVIKGRLPDPMHNAMTLITFSDPGSKWAKKYFSAKKYQKVKKCAV